MNPVAWVQVPKDAQHMFDGGNWSCFKWEIVGGKNTGRVLCEIIGKDKGLVFTKTIQHGGRRTRVMGVPEENVEVF